ncbi:ligase-associated DNA damage response endonuclease PdeM [Asticcacaulis solisilvae]|uniref:ligase-associated DNA damage response endonuclease PdeM n=1 Tax=Asticcacaulis solisilvae TaxID=1217274 RepID=UPI003FD8B212
MPSSIEVRFAGHDMVLDAELALYWPEQDALVVSDLHLEKSTYLAQFGSAVAPYDTLDTLVRLDALRNRYRPKALILLGDSFHDRAAWTRLEPAARDSVLAICNAVETCHLVEGNHDLGLTASGLNFCEEVVLDGLVFRHEPDASSRPQVVGHFHPAISTELRGHRLRGKCFAMNGRMLIMPAFGSFTGGLSLHDSAFSELAGDDPFRPYLVYRNTVAAIRSA